MLFWGTGTHALNCVDNCLEFEIKTSSILQSKNFYIGGMTLDFYIRFNTIKKSTYLWELYNHCAGKGANNNACSGTVGFLYLNENGEMMQEMVRKTYHSIKSVHMIIIIYLLNFIFLRERVIMKLSISSLRGLKINGFNLLL